LRRGVTFLILGAALTLAGCATNTQNDYAESDAGRLARYQYLSHTRADPLGAYLAANYPTSSAPQAPRAMASTALKFLGVKYRFGGDAPSTGFDCSGLVSYAAEKSLGLKLPRQSAEMAREGESVKLTELKKGDLVFFNTRGFRNSHVGIYLGNQQFVHAPRKGAVVRVESMDISYWKKRYNGARRLAAEISSTPLVATN
jgi:cell wall-associated NlpC family hydrolase